MFGAGKSRQEVLGKCPKCGADVVKGNLERTVPGKCGMNVGKGTWGNTFRFTGQEPASREKILVKGLKGKKGSYDAYLIPERIEEFSTRRTVKKSKGLQYKFKMEFPPKRTNRRKQFQNNL